MDVQYQPRKPGWQAKLSALSHACVPPSRRVMSAAALHPGILGEVSSHLEPISVDVSDQEIPLAQLGCIMQFRQHGLAPVVPWQASAGRRTKS